MRVFVTALTAAAVALPLASVSFAQTTTSPAPAAPAPTMAAPAPTTAAPAAPMAPGMTMAPQAAAPAKKTHKRQSLQQHFDVANAAHDGHLTLDEARAAKWSYVVKHFTAIDKDRKGFVTVDDIHAYAHVVHTARHVTPKPAAPAAATTTN